MISEIDFEYLKNILEYKTLLLAPLHFATNNSIVEFPLCIYTLIYMQVYNLVLKQSNFQTTEKFANKSETKAQANREYWLLANYKITYYNCKQYTNTSEYASVCACVWLSVNWAIFACKSKVQPQFTVVNKQFSFFAH